MKKMRIVFMNLNIFYLKILLFCIFFALAVIYILNKYYIIDTKLEQDIVIERTQDICKNLLNLPTAHRQNILSSPPQRKNNSLFYVSYNYFEAIQKYETNETVTYCTHATPEFIDNIKELANSWDGPISISVYSPATDICLAVERILFMRNCESPEIKAKVNWHFYWLKNALPYIDLSKTFIETMYACSVVPNFALKTWRVMNNHSYPINVGRNIARKGAQTYYVLPSDVELIPSHNLASQFMKYISKKKYGHFNVLNSKRKVFVIPVFETKSIIAKNKQEISHQLLNGSSVYFHKFVCRHCQRFPKFEKWVKYYGHTNEITEFSIVRRQFPYHRWEPIFICTNNEPFYDEELSWEGLQDKMAQVHELCLLNYNFIILDTPFLVHLPGIKRRKDKKEVNGWREIFIKSNSLKYNDIMKELETKYGFQKECRKH